jgi:hypothetical protein
MLTQFFAETIAANLIALNFVCHAPMDQHLLCDAHAEASVSACRTSSNWFHEGALPGPLQVERRMSTHVCASGPPCYPVSEVGSVEHAVLSVLVPTMKVR